MKNYVHELTADELIELERCLLAMIEYGSSGCYVQAYESGRSKKSWQVKLQTAKSASQKIGRLIKEQQKVEKNEDKEFNNKK